MSRKMKKRIASEVEADKIHIKLPLYVVPPENLRDKVFSFKNDEGKSLLKISYYLPKYWKAYEDLPTLIKEVDENYFYILQDENNDIHFYTSIITDGRKTVGGTLDLRIPENRQGFTAVSPLEGYGAKGTGYQPSSISGLFPIEENEYNKFCDDNIEITLLMNAVVDRTMIDLNSSFFTSKVGKEAMDKYLNGVYSIYDTISKPPNMDLNDLEEHITNFLQNEKVAEQIIELRNQYDEAFINYREQELYCILYNDDFLKEKEFLTNIPIEDYDRYNYLVGEFEKIEYYNSLGEEKINEIKNTYSTMQAELLEKTPDTDYVEILKNIEKIKEVEKYFENPELLNDMKYELESYDLDIGRDRLYKYQVYEDIYWYYDRNRELYPIYNSKFNPREMTQYKQDYSRYEEEYNHYIEQKRILKYEKIEKELEKYFSEEELALMRGNNFACKEKMDKLIKENLQIMRELKNISNLEADEWEKSFEGEDLTKVIFNTAQFEDVNDLNLILENNRRIELLNSYIHNSPNVYGYEANLDPINGSHYVLKLEKEFDANDCDVTTNMKINEKILADGKLLFGVKKDWDEVKNKENVTVKDKYVFYDMFDDMYKCKEHLIYLESQKNYEEQLLEEKLNRYNAGDTFIEKENAIIELAEGNYALNLTNQKIEFLKEYIRSQKIELDAEKEEKYRAIGGKLFGEEEFDSFSGSYQEIYLKYKEIGLTLGTHINILEENRKNLENDPNNGEYKKAIRGSEEVLKELSEKYYLVREYLKENNLTIKEKVEEAKKDTELVKDLNILERDKLSLDVISEKVERNNEVTNFETIVVEDKEFKVSNKSNFAKEENEQEKLTFIREIADKKYVDIEYINNQIIAKTNELNEKGKEYSEKIINGRPEELEKLNNEIIEINKSLNDLKTLNLNNYNIVIINENIDVNLYKNEIIKNFEAIESVETINEIERKIENLDKEILSAGLATSVLKIEKNEDLKIEDLEKFIKIYEGKVSSYSDKDEILENNKIALNYLKIINSGEYEKGTRVIDIINDSSLEEAKSERLYLKTFYDSINNYDKLKDLPETSMIDELQLENEDNTKGLDDEKDLDDGFGNEL